MSFAFLLSDTDVPPHVDRIRDQTITEDEVAVFVTRFTGKPEPRVEWLMGSRILVDDGDDVKIVTRRQTSELTLRDVRPGKYTVTVRVSNEAGTDSQSAKLVVKGEH